MKWMRMHAGKNQVANGHLDATAQVPQNRIAPYETAP